MYNGSVQVTLDHYASGVPTRVIDESIELCGKETGLTCPLDEGDHSVKFSEPVPTSAPGVSGLAKDWGNSLPLPNHCSNCSLL